MIDLNTAIAARAPGLTLSVADVLQALKREGRLRPLFVQVLLRQFVVQAARSAGLAVGADELQKAADRFRQQRGLATAEKTHAWLAHEGLSVEDLERALEEDLLVERFRQHLAEPRRAAHFAANQQGYERVRLRQLVVPTESLAREVLSQVRDEGRSFTAIAGEQGMAAPVRLLFRCDLPATVAQLTFAARPGDAIGPFGGPEGFQVLLVEEHLAAVLDEATTARIQQELFDSWLADRFRDSPPEFPFLAPV